MEESAAMNEQRRQLAGLITGYWMSQAIHVAAKLRLADLLEEGPQTASELATATNCQTEPLSRLLRALASVGVFAQQEDGRFVLTPTAELLRTDHPDSLHAMAVMIGGGTQYTSWGELLWSVQTGQTGFQKVYGKPIFQYLEEHPKEAAEFDAAMTAIHGQETSAVLDVYDFSQARKLIDVGGGNGTQLTEMLLRHPHLKGVVFDLPHVAERTEARLVAVGLGDRISCQGGSFFETIPSGGDIYLLRHILHDWYDSECHTILKHIAAVMPPKGRLLIIESVIQPGNDADFAKWLDLTMLVAPGGKERTAGEYEALLTATGFQLQQIFPTNAGVSVLEAVHAEP